MKKWKIEVEVEDKFIYLQLSDDEEYQLTFYQDKEAAKEDIIQFVMKYINNIN